MRYTRANWRPPLNLPESIVSAWQTNNRITSEFVASLPSNVWTLEVPGVPRRTVRNIAAHLHNSRCSWIRTLGSEHAIAVPARVDRHRASPRQVATALSRSGAGIEALLRLAFAADGSIPPSKGYVWRNLALDVGHVLTYFVTHDGHHRGQILMAARQAGHRLPPTVSDKLWWWKPPQRSHA